MPAKVNLVPGWPWPFELERLTEFVPKLDQQPIMIHFCSASGLCLPLQEHKPGSLQKEFTCTKCHDSGMLYPLGEAPFKN